MVGQGLMPPGWSSCFSSSAYPCLGTKQRLPVKRTGLDGVFLCQPGQFRFHQKNWPRSLTRSIAWPSSPRCLSQTCNRFDWTFIVAHFGMALFATTSDPLVSGVTSDSNYYGGYGPCDFPVAGVKIVTKSHSHPRFDTPTSRSAEV